jgi:tetratricopeptide (TPR) repeat protein
MKKIIAETAEEWFKKGVEALETKKYDEAIDCFKKAISINPDDEIAEIAHYSLGVAYADKGMLDESISEYKKAISINPDYAGAHLSLGITYCICGMDDVDADHLYKAGLLFLKQGNKGWALKAYEALKLTKAEGLQKALFKKIYPEIKKR